MRLQSINIIKSTCLLPSVVVTLFSAHIFEDISINEEVMHNAVEFFSMSQESKKKKKFKHLSKLPDE